MSRPLTTADLRERIRGQPSQSGLVNLPRYYWALQYYSVVVAQLGAAGSPTRLFQGVAQKPVELFRIYSAAGNLGFVVIGGSNLNSFTNGMDQLHPGEALTMEVETNFETRNEFLDVSQFFGASSVGNSALLLTLGWRDQR